MLIIWQPYGAFGYGAAQMATLPTHCQWAVTVQRDTCQCQTYVTSSVILGNNIKNVRYNVDSNELCNKIQVFFDVTLCRWENNYRRFGGSYWFRQHRCKKLKLWKCLRFEVLTAASMRFPIFRVECDVVYEFTLKMETTFSQKPNYTFSWLLC